jgi:hypothetical protein
MGRVVPLLVFLVACGDPDHAPSDAAEDATDAPTIDGASGTFSAAPAAVTFNALVNTTVRDTVTFTNTGPASAPVSATLGGANPAAFMLESSTCSGALGAGASCTVDIAFRATAASTYTATLTLTDGASSAVVALTGFGTNTIGLSVLPALRDFGTVAVATTSSYFSFTVTNTGTAPTGAVGLAFDTGATADYLLASNLCSGATLPAQGTCTFSVGFRPTVLGTRTATLKLTDPASGGQAGVSVTGTGVTGTGGLVFAPATYDFGTVTVGDSAFAHQFTLTNNATSATGTITTAKGGANLGDFLKMADNCNAQALGPGASCTLFVAFEPGAAGARSAVITATASPGGTASTDVSGTGQ